MRFNCCPDSLSLFGAGELTLMCIAHSDPINRVDPSGYLIWQARLDIGLGVSALALAVFTAPASIAAAGAVSAAIESASAISLVVGNPRRRG